MVHALLIAGLRPMAVAYVPPAPLRVELREAPRSDPVAPMQVAPSPEPASIPVPDSSRAVPDARPVQPQANTAPAPVAGPAIRRMIDEYYKPNELDVRAEPLNDVSLVYPEAAYQRRIKGKVLLRILISAAGKIDEVAVLDSEPHGVFEEAALTATWAVQFSPAIKSGRRVKSQKTLEVVFDPYESIHIP